MRYVVLLLITICALGEPCTESSNPKYKAYDPNKAVYQKKRFFKSRVSVPGKVDWQSLHQAEMSQKGLKLFWVGCICLVLGIASSCSFKNKIADTLGSFVGFIGAGFIVVGMLTMKIAEAWKWLGAGVLIIVIIGAVIYFRDKGLELPKKVKPKAKRR